MNAYGLFSGMGRSSLTYRQRLESEIAKWSSFRRALLRDEREAFDRLIDNAFRYVHAGAMCPEQEAFKIFIMSVLLDHEYRLMLLEKRLKQLRSAGPVVIKEDLNGRL
jgi:hypothetical protein